GTLAACGGSAAASSVGPGAPANPAASSPGSGSSARQAAIANGADPARTDAAGIEWLCQPGLADDPCAANNTANVVPRTGPTTVQKASATTNPRRRHHRPLAGLGHGRGTAAHPGGPQP